jgi:uncharacterized protein
MRKFVYALDNDKYDQAKDMLARDRSLADRVLTQFGQTEPPLLRMTRENKRETARVLLDAGANPNIVGASGYAALHVATLAGNLQMASLLLDYGANADPVDSNGETPILLACKYNSPQMATFLIQRGAASFAQADTDGYNCAQYATLNGALPILETLAAAGAPIDTRDEKAPILLALERNNSDIARFLLNHGASVTRLDAKGRTELIIAIANDNMELVSALVSSGANPDARTNDGDSALFAALRQRDSLMLSLLLDSGANVEQRDGAGDTPLLKAAELGLVEACKTLVLYGADPYAQDRRGATAIDRARARGHDTADMEAALSLG